MKCPKCGKVLFRLENGEYICAPDCGAVYTEKELQDIKEIEKIEEDMLIWRETKTMKKG